MYKNTILQNIRQYVISNYQRINHEDMTMGNCYYNRRCHINSVQKVKEGKAEKVYSCIAIDKENKNNIVVHFINQTKEGKYIDDTWGWVYETWDYYLIREIKESEYNTIWNILNDIKKTLIKQNSNRILRKIFFIDLLNVI